MRSRRRARVAGGCGTALRDPGKPPRRSRVASTPWSPATPAGSSFTPRRAHPRIRYLAARAESAPLRERWADVVTVAQALHWLDLPEFYAEVRRVLAPRGLFVAWTYGVQRMGDGAMDAVLEDFYDRVVGPYWAPERRLVETGYRTLDFPFDEVPLASPPMTGHWTLGQLLGYVSTWSAVAKCRNVTGVDPMLELQARLEPLWGEPERQRHIEWPITVRAGR